MYDGLLAYICIHQGSVSKCKQTHPHTLMYSLGFLAFTGKKCKMNAKSRIKKMALPKVLFYTIIFNFRKDIYSFGPKTVLFLLHTPRCTRQKEYMPFPETLLLILRIMYAPLLAQGIHLIHNGQCLSMRHHGRFYHSLTQTALALKYLILVSADHILGLGVAGH